MANPQKVIVLGSGESGLGAAILAQKEGYEVFVSDLGPIKDSIKTILKEQQIPFEENQHTQAQIFAANIVVKSPGIPDHIPLILDLQKAGIPVIGEIEFAYNHLEGPAEIIGITGSNGKTTTTLLTYHLLQSAGLEVHLGGNIGNSFARLVAEGKTGIFVLELSSFQLDGIENFKPNIGVLLNITADHLDRYEYKLENYVASKFRLIKNMDQSDLLIYNASDERIARYLWNERLKPTIIPIVESMTNESVIEFNNQQFDLSNTPIRGRHNYQNTLFALCIAEKFKIPKSTVESALRSFSNAPHRLEWVDDINEVEYINDSKATNVDAVYYALDAMEKPIIWIAGGTDKGNDYEDLNDLVKQKVKALIGLGVDNHKMLKHFEAICPVIVDTHSMESAIHTASELATPGDVVLLSPACASFDLFNNYEDRGNQFRSLVKQIK